MRYKRPIGCASVIVLLAVGIPLLVPVIRRANVARRAEADYRKLAESGSSTVYSHYPEIFDRILSDQQLAERITHVHLIGFDNSNPDYSAVARLPNVAEIEVTYTHNVESIVPTINRMPKVTKALFAYCDSTKAWLRDLKNLNLEILQIHGYQPQHVSAEDVEACQRNMPNCAITVSDDSNE